ncbi:MAG: ABC transporter permease, partial [Bacteroidales bacterium]|nr:ABC transporter permease [Bacteroidales bacterium]
KLIITVIHQPSSEIYKMFDKMIILDHGGEMIYYGNPVEALIHFKTLDSQIDSSIGECPACGNINPEAIFNIVETEVVDEFGKYTGKRKTTPGVWAKYFSADHPPGELTKVKQSPPSNLNIPSIFKQWRIFSKRDFISKLANKQYVLLTLLEAPVLGFMLAYIIRYIADPSSNIYIFRENENIPIYIFMSLIVALFLGLIASAEEIYKDKKILKREYFLHLSRKSYLLAKIGNLFIISAIQALLFVAIANPVLGIKGLHIQYWLAFFTTAACANLIGLNISASFNSAITIYIIVPIIMIPMMVLSGAMFPFDKLNRTIGSVERVPFLAEIIPTRWTYEALMVTQAKDNHYDILVYETDKIISEADFNTTYRLPELKTALNNTVLAYRKKELSEENPAKLNLIYNEFRKIAESNKTEEFENTNKLNPTEFNHIIAEEAQNYIDHLIALYTLSSNSAFIKKDKFISLNKEALDMLFNNYHNNKLEDIVEKRYEVHKIINYKDNLIQNTDPIYYTPENRGPLNFRTHFFAPTKPIIGMQADTFFFNIIIVWLMTISQYFILYFELLRRLINTLLDND